MGLFYKKQKPEMIISEKHIYAILKENNIDSKVICFDNYYVHERLFPIKGDDNKYTIKYFSIKYGDYLLKSVTDWDYEILKFNDLQSINNAIYLFSCNFFNIEEYTGRSNYDKEFKIPKIK